MNKILLSLLLTICLMLVAASPALAGDDWCGEDVCPPQFPAPPPDSCQALNNCPPPAQCQSPLDTACVNPQPVPPDSCQALGTCPPNPQCQSPLEPGCSDDSPPEY